MEEKSKKRLEYIDIARGIAIIFMITGHIVIKGTKFCNVIYSFHMPLFIITSGMFFKEKSFKKFIINIIKNLLLPYIIIIFLFYFLKPVILNVKIDSLKKIFLFCIKILFKSNIESIGIFWFMPMLAVLKISFWNLKKLTKENDALLGSLCVILSGIGYYIGKIFVLNFSIDIAWFGIMYYFIGYFVMKYNLLDKIINNYKILIVFLIIWILGANIYRDMAWREYGNGLITIIVAVSASFIVIKISSIIFKKCKILRNFLAWYGKNSLYILLFHFIESELIQYDLVLDYKLSLHRMILIIIKLAFATIETFLLTFTMKLMKDIKKIEKGGEA